MSDKKQIVAVVGPTASGKSGLAMKIAAKYNGTIVCCDSMQIYRGMDIGTAKPTAEDMCGLCIGGANGNRRNIRCRFHARFLRRHGALP